MSTGIDRVTRDTLFPKQERQLTFDEPLHWRHDEWHGLHVPLLFSKKPSLHLQVKSD
jgi:hypothetical protein